jgi:hypothetical protein
MGFKNSKKRRIERQTKIIRRLIDEKTVYEARARAAERERERIAGGRDARHLRCGSCGEQALHFIVLDGFDVPACLRHLNVWKSPDFADADTSDGEES